MNHTNSCDTFLITYTSFGNSLNFDFLNLSLYTSFHNHCLGRCLIVYILGVFFTKNEKTMNMELRENEPNLKMKIIILPHLRSTELGNMHES